MNGKKTGGGDGEVLLKAVVERHSHQEASVSWTKFPMASAYSIVLEDPRTCNGEWTFHAENHQTSFKFPVTLKAGHKYTVTVKALKMRYRDGTVFYQSIRTYRDTFRAVFTEAELRQLQKMATKYVQLRGDEFFIVEYFYRNKPEVYFDYIHRERKGIMETYRKDDNGDPASIINGQINGLFFATGIDRATGLPPRTSYFGEKRIYVPAATLYSDSTRLYFADFYCNKQAHYVTLVMTHHGSDADKFCEKNLLAVNIYKNEFLFMDGLVHVTMRLHVEVFYTENMDLNQLCSIQGAYFDRVEVNMGTSTPGGLPKNPHCTVCNLPKKLPNNDHDEIN